jgi:hypothetical protein
MSSVNQKPSIFASFIAQANPNSRKNSNPPVQQVNSASQAGQVNKTTQADKFHKSSTYTPTKS